MSISIYHTTVIALLITLLAPIKASPLLKSAHSTQVSSSIPIPSYKTQGTPDKTVLIVGDSLSTGYGFNFKQSWVNLLQVRLSQQQKNYQVVNASISGNTTQNGLTHLSKLLKTTSPTVVILALGGNDGLRGLPIKTIRDNLAQMITLAQSHQAQVLLVGVRLPPNYGPDYTQQFSQVYQNLAKQYSIALIPQFLKGISDDATGRFMQADGIHPTEAAQPRMLENIWPVLSKILDSHDQG